MYFDGATNHSRYGIDVLLISLHVDHILRVVFLAILNCYLATNNIFKYEASILRLEIALELGIR